MIFKSKKKKLSKEIQKIVSDVVSNRQLADECANMTNTDETASFIYTETIIQQIHSLVFILDRKYRNKHKWTTWDYVSENISHGIEVGMGNADFVPIALKGLSRLMNMDGKGQERIQNLYNSSADLILEQDPELDRNEIVEFIDTNIHKFMMGLERYRI